MTEPDFLKSVVDNGERLREALAEFPQVTEVRGRGLMVACELPGVSAADLVKQLLTEQHLVANATGPTTLRLLPPLIVSADDIDDAVGRIRAVLG